MSEGIEGVRRAEEWLKRDRARGLAELNRLFRAGGPPAPPLDGRYPGEIVAVDVAPGLNRLGRAFLADWMGWKGKSFDAASSRGDNLFARRSLPLARLLWPMYRGFVADGPESYRAFEFRTYLERGLADPDREVLRIDYDLPANPALSVRHLLDELVQVAEGLYLGKSHFKWWWGRWQLAAYFVLSDG